ncbi:MAG: 2OG-Fe(II) oxygenase [Sphingomonadaceae bacterium]|nr:2OG-Fe(II) oxygenase [Sphingomonadaceae bacterium]
MSRTYLALPDAFDDAECDRIIALADAVPGEPGPLYTGAGRRVDRALRDVCSSLVDRETAPWLFARLDALFGAGAEAFGLAVGPLSEPVQVLRYDEGGHFQVWHSDAGGDTGERRLISMSVELSAASAYEGGALEVIPDLAGRPRTLGRGGVHLFPSRALHRVVPVTRGTRWALVAWTGMTQG